jgi:hypothetical protein
MYSVLSFCDSIRGALLWTRVMLANHLLASYELVILGLPLGYIHEKRFPIDRSTLSLKSRVQFSKFLLICS